MFHGMVRWSRSQLYIRIVVVDSTRAGKRIPDALSKTVPIWCAVVNRATAKRFPRGIPPEWETSLFTPPASVSRQEHHQIEECVGGWAEGLVVNTHSDRTGVGL